MQQQEYVKSMHKRIGDIATGMLDGSIHYLQGALELAELRNEIGAYENDPDFIAFVGVSAKMNNSSIDTSGKNWIKNVSIEEQLEIQKSVEWAKEFSLSECQTLAQRYKTK